MPEDRTVSRGNEVRIIDVMVPDRPNVSLRQRHANRTRVAIVDVAFELFRQRGFSGTTVDEIAARADIAPRTFFRYFETKEAVLYHDTDQIIDCLRDRLAARPSNEPPYRSVLSVCLQLGDDLTADATRIRLLRELSLDQPELIEYQRIVLLRQFEHAIIDSLTTHRNLDSNDIQLRATTVALLSTLATAFQLWIDNGAHGSIRPTMHQALTACRHAFNDEPPDVLRPGHDGDGSDNIPQAFTTPE